MSELQLSRSYRPSSSRASLHVREKSVGPSSPLDGLGAAASPALGLPAGRREQLGWSDTLLLSLSYFLAIGAVGLGR